MLEIICANLINLSLNLNDSFAKTNPLVSQKIEILDNFRERELTPDKEYLAKGRRHESDYTRDVDRQRRQIEDELDDRIYYRYDRRDGRYYRIDGRDDRRDGRDYRRDGLYYRRDGRYYRIDDRDDRRDGKYYRRDDRDYRRDDRDDRRDGRYYRIDL